MMHGGERGDNMVEIIFEIICLFSSLLIFSFVINKIG